MRTAAIMATRTDHSFFQRLSQNRFFILLVLILLTIGLTPFLDQFIHTRMLMDFFLTAVFLAVVFAIGSKRSHLIISLILLLPLIVSTWSIYFHGINEIKLLPTIFGALFFGYTVIIILQIVFRSTEVTRETIFAAVVAYLLVALMWAFVYMILEFLIPGSFSFPEQGTWSGAQRFHYLSFVTITTLGYGDITPTTGMSSALALLEAVIGQIYLVVLVAWLVGTYVSRKSR
jgi:hypothetical protein